MATPGVHLHCNWIDMSRVVIRIVPASHGLPSLGAQKALQFSATGECMYKIAREELKVHLYALNIVTCPSDHPWDVACNQLGVN